MSLYHLKDILPRRIVVVNTDWDWREETCGVPQATDLSARVAAFAFAGGTCGGAAPATIGAMGGLEAGTPALGLGAAVLAAVEVAVGAFAAGATAL